MTAYLTPTLTSAIVLPLFQILREQGQDPNEICDFNSNWLTNGLQLPIEQLDRLLEQANHQVKDPALALKLGARLDWRKFRLLAYLLSECRTGRDALSQLRRYYPLISDSQVPDVFIGNRSVKIVFYVSDGTPHTRQMRAEVIAAGIHDIGSKLGTGFYRITGIGFSQPPGAGNKSQLEQHFGVPVRFNEGCNWISFACDNLDNSIRGAYPLLEKMLDGAEVPWQEENLDKSFSNKLRHILYYWPPCLPMTKESVADLLGTSARTLTRRLQEEGSQFSELSKHCRLLRAAAALQRTSKDVQQLANELGFSDRRGFERAFKQWTGQTPAAFRKQCKGAPTMMNQLAAM
jgi:AraC-like DNA-binding protein